jgi:hypothetical protein
MGPFGRKVTDRLTIFDCRFSIPDCRSLRSQNLHATVSFRAQRGISLCLRPIAGQRIRARFLAALGMTAGDEGMMDRGRAQK